MLDDTKIDAVAQRLRALPPKESTLSSKAATVRRLRPAILDALQNGYSHAEISDLLAEDGLKISPGTLKSYLARDKKAKSSTRRKHSGSKMKANPSPPEKSSMTIGRAVDDEQVAAGRFPLCGDTDDL